ncbi:MAG: helix-turn-helix domain-containing protein [Gemmataceae bacterium]
MQKKKRKRTTSPPTLSIEASSGNVYADLGFPYPEEALAKAELVMRIARLIRRQKLTQAKAAALKGIDQPKISSLLRGQFQGYSLERLFRFLNCLGQNVEIVIKPRGRGTNSEASTQVAANTDQG